jgi:predicted nucleotidyltransferase component of viral defense system
MKKKIKDLPASIHARLKQQAVEMQRPFQEVLYYYVMESFLYRLSQSRYCKNLILKGGLAFSGWGLNLRRPTLDIDFQASIINSIEEVTSVVKDICAVSIEEDGIVFDTASMEVTTIMPKAEYEGVRLRFRAYLGRSLIWLQVDVSFANVITPKEVEIEYPTLLNRPNFGLLVYNRETSIAEKFQSMVFWGLSNGRLKDYYDIYLLAKECDFDGSLLAKAFVATFAHRNTDIPADIPSALSDDFINLNRDEWLNFLKNTSYQDDAIKEFSEVVEFLKMFLTPPMQAAAKGKDYDRYWKAGGSWSG